MVHWAELVMEGYKPAPAQAERRSEVRLAAEPGGQIDLFGPATEGGHDASSSKYPFAFRGQQLKGFRKKYSPRVLLPRDSVQARHPRRLIAPERR